MKKSLILLLPFILLGAGCISSSPQTIESDFEPPRVTSSLPNEAEGETSHVAQQQIKTAVSYDGETFIQTGESISHQAANPDAVVTEDGTIYLYYSAWMIGDTVNTAGVAISEDNAQTWIYKYVNVTDAGKYDRILNPEVVLLEDGTFRLYYNNGDPIGIHYAEGKDGINFEYKGAAFAMSDHSAENPLVYKNDDGWHLYFQTEEEELWYFESIDGISFDITAITSFPVNGISHIPSDISYFNDWYHLLLFNENGTIESMKSKNASDWYEGKTLLSPVDEETYVKDATVIQLENGNLLMIYTTNG